MLMYDQSHWQRLEFMTPLTMTMNQPLCIDATKTKTFAHKIKIKTKTFTHKTKTSHHCCNSTLHNEYVNSSYVSHTAISVILCQNSIAFQIDQDLQKLSVILAR